MSKKTFRLENGTVVTADVEVYRAYQSFRNKERYLKRKRNEFVTRSLDDGAAHNISSADNVEEEVSRRFEIELLRHAVRQLPQNERRLVNEYFFEDASLRNLAKKYGVSHTTVRKNINHILFKLKQYIINKEV